MVQQNTNMRDFKISRKENEWYNVEVTDSYGNEYQSYFETAFEVNEWVYHIWDKEEWFNSENSQELLANAIENCKRLDSKLNIREI